MLLFYNLNLLADSFYFTGDLQDAVEWYEKLIKEYPQGLDPEYLFRYSQSLKSVERYQEAVVIADEIDDGDLATAIRESMVEIHALEGDTQASSQVLQKIENYSQYIFALK